MSKDKAYILNNLLDPKCDIFSTVIEYFNSGNPTCSYVPKKKQILVLISTDLYNSAAVELSKPTQKPLQTMNYNSCDAVLDTIDEMFEEVASLWIWQASW